MQEPLLLFFFGYISKDDEDGKILSETEKLLRNVLSQEGRQTEVELASNYVPQHPKNLRNSTMGESDITSIAEMVLNSRVIPQHIPTSDFKLLKGGLNYQGLNLAKEIGKKCTELSYIERSIINSAQAPHALLQKVLSTLQVRSTYKRVKKIYRRGRNVLPLDIVGRNGGG